MNETSNSGKQPHLIYGIRPVIEAIEEGLEIDRIYVQKGSRGGVFQELWPYIKERGLPFKHVPLDKLNKLTRKNHQGVIAYVSAVPFGSVEDILPSIWERGETPLLLLLDRLTDVRNVGAIARSAECAGVHAIVIPEKHSAPMHEDAVKSSAGALLRVPVCRVKNLQDTLHFLHDSGIESVACTEKTEEEMYALNFNQPLAIVMGSEEDGISPAVMKLCKHRARIPMMGNIGSLNVSVAAGIVLWETVRQRKA
ncbi:MAG: 23S rRNA (guanosine(2251)-2'-O)-methyltransferase RlmB [Bacteroidetes bacterium]|uniref:23S rRNA (Guanosine(2251)-2'-O)-methyltransferase RlmB n=1 Tax=Phaeocystidibacter marisrubri TaxID=1577780 RepID=A0A6L3ZI13_9FLAO|nr:23S rRNA (guanosine(2251)-2'-O)-methyltransferase RlmB [Phaeocystidibacter marisrubri]KAB2817259.1 23S rRNA (guanosine(2251)-2'-O)-methyltransferase RlmB [Phaeocystidibacter marisrubri]TNE27720.1 MAG: 23S rRNA (guanosine(2251)-2'-O)-methyltransferase RlmB [Bacteroidota bacterium]GGH76210.1 23S rRNA (guanosine(2251)-2'-O)-methyltransferase RlmB [Phaeocystidibacter marisrubri]